MNYIELFQVYSFNDKIRLGTKNDGGYVIADLHDNYDCYISCGISNEESFSRDFLNKYKLNKFDCYAFDGTIDKYPHEYTTNILFIKNNISDINNNYYTDLSYLINKYNNIFLKMDIEGGEYNWLLHITEDQLRKFKQIVIEFHGINDNSWNCSHSNKIKCFEKLNKTHYIVHAHGNSYSNITNKIPDVIELTYINKEYFLNKPDYNTDYTPIPHLDSSNCPNKGDIDLNFYPFKCNSSFPKVIHLVHKNYELLQKSYKQWSNLNPEYHFELYDDERCRTILLDNFGKLHLDIFDYIKDGPIKCDFFRICILYLKGGIYVDSDIKPLISLSNFIEDDIDFSTCISYNYNTNLQTWNYNPQFILAKKYDLYLYSIINKYVDYYVNNIEYSYWKWSICFLMHKINAFDIMPNSDNVFLLNGKKYKFFIECILDKKNNIIFNYTNCNHENISKYPNHQLSVVCAHKNTIIFDNFSNK